MTADTTTKHVNLLTDVLAPRYQLPDGYDSWGIKSVRPDLRTRNDFRWPWPGNETERFELDNHDNPCPIRRGDGLCVALTWAGMAAAGFSARTLLLVAFRTSEARGNDEKLRVPQAYVVDVIDGQQLLVTDGTRADLSGAYLPGADLHRANLFGANLHLADLFGANLFGANLHRANLFEANLHRANLSGANLHRANLSEANLFGADLHRANLSGANLHRANLSEANLFGADLSGADLHRANLFGADLSGHNTDTLKNRGARL